VAFLVFFAAAARARIVAPRLWRMHHRSLPVPAAIPRAHELQVLQFERPTRGACPTKLVLS
jgi:hypothetical protein